MKTNEIDAAASSPVPSVDVGGDGNRLPQPTALGAAFELLSTLDAVAKGQMLEGFRQKLGRVVAGIIWDEHWNDLDEHAKGDAMRAAEGVLLTFYDAAPTASPAGDDRKDGLPRSVGSTAEPSWLTRCCRCTRLIDKREKEDGGDPFGCELNDGRWTCSFECWGAEVGSPESDDPDPSLAAARSSSTEAVEQEVERLRAELQDHKDAIDHFARHYRRNKTKLWVITCLRHGIAFRQAERSAPSLPGKEEGRG